ncbi:acyl-CoA dehydrogenase family protein [Aquihabitans sp. McL0605]|uniref:acyl-CoA dehydrogenase family protein n=1 Tax=Aquihabitans sp. McL0605 TaxID=3415671 RepID=UPI003CEA3AB4
MTDDRDEREAFRAEVRSWLDEHAPAKGSPEDFSAAHLVSAMTREAFEAAERSALEVTQRWQRTLHEAGYAGRSWPEEYGGQGAPEWQSAVLAEEQVRYGVSTKMLAIALEMAPPVLLRHGTHEQRRAHLPSIVRGDEAWCQLLSEPDAGSDLTNVQTLATAVDGGWSVTGQKVWTSGAGAADFALLLARTDRSKPGREGVSCFAMPMRQDGVTVRPLRQMSGGYHFNEVFLDGTLVDEGGLIGDLGEGFAVLRTMLASERAAIGGGTSARSATQLRALAIELGRSSEPLVRQALARAHTRERLLDLVGARAASVPTGGSIVKLLYSEHARLSGDAALAILGPAAMVVDHPVAAPWLDRFLFAPGLRLGGGTDEIQRNTIAERGLGLPREPRPAG